jgi:hypothetical protein
MGELRIVKLGPVSNGTEAVSFEDAFGYGVGGYSYADGAGRAKRKQRKLERISNRTEVKSARQDARGTRTEGRQENRENRVAGRQSVQKQRVAGRTDLQLSRKDKRLTKREMGTESRTGRRIQRADTRAYKRGLRNPADSGLDQTIPGEMGDAPVDSLQEANQEQVYDDGGQGYDDGQVYDDGGISGDQTGQGSYYGDETQYDGPEYGSENDSEDIYGEDTYGEDAVLDDAYEQGYQDAQEDFDNEEVSVDENFDGVMGAEDRFNEMQDTNDIIVNPTVQDLADKTVWNEKLIEALKFQRKNATGNPQEISKTILVRAKRLKDLNGELVDYANACGNYSNADGSPEVVSARKREVMMARRRALAKSTRPKQGRGYAGDVTPVNADLNPVIEKNRIVVPAESSSNATGTGINGLDLVDDFDAPAIREVYLGADGSFTKGIDLGSIAVGVLLAVGFIALNKQYKWIKL